MPKIQCRTNIDCCRRLAWPTELPEVPRAGDLIRSPSSTDKKHIELQVGRVTWVHHLYAAWGSEWVPEVELHMVPNRFENCSAFERWVERSE